MYNIDEIRSNLSFGLQQLWVMIQKEEKKILGIVITQIDEFPRGRMLRIMYLGGTGFTRSMMLALGEIEKWAKKKHVDCIDVLGRDEWGKLLAHFDYEAIGRVYRRKLS